MANVIEEAKSGRASCRTCKKAIAKGELRFGEEAPNAFGDTPSMRWHHLACAAEQAARRAQGRARRRTRARCRTAPSSSKAMADAISKGHAKPGGMPYVDKAPTGRARCMQCERGDREGQPARRGRARDRDRRDGHAGRGLPASRRARARTSMPRAATAPSSSRACARTRGWPRPTWPRSIEAVETGAGELDETARELNRNWPDAGGGRANISACAACCSPCCSPADGARARELGRPRSSRHGPPACEGAAERPTRMRTKARAALAVIDGTAWVDDRAARTRGAESRHDSSRGRNARRRRSQRRARRSRAGLQPWRATILERGGHGDRRSAARRRDGSLAGAEHLERAATATTCAGRRARTARRYVVEYLRGAVAEVRALYPDLPDARDRRSLGRARRRAAPATSRTSSGRDVDVGFYFHHAPHRGFEDAGDDLDLEATWALLAAFARTADRDDGVQMIFLDYAVQKRLYDFAKARGTPDDELAFLFQYPARQGRDDRPRPPLAEPHQPLARAVQALCSPRCCRSTAAAREIFGVDVAAKPHRDPPAASASPGSTPRSTRTSPAARTSWLFGRLLGPGQRQARSDRRRAARAASTSPRPPTGRSTKFSGGMRRRLDLAASA